MLTFQHYSVSKHVMKIIRSRIKTSVGVEQTSWLLSLDPGSPLPFSVDVESFPFFLPFLVDGGAAVVGLVDVLFVDEVVS